MEPAAEEREIPDWMKMPAALQRQFFTHAEEEAKKCKRQLISRVKRIEELKQFIRVEGIPEDSSWRKWRVAVVDGSNSPVTSERLGVRYGTYSAAYMIFEGSEQVDEGFGSNAFSEEQIGNPETAQTILSMLRLNLERDVAIECLRWKNVDLLLLDGSFFGFRFGSPTVKEEYFTHGGYRKGDELVRDVRDKSIELLESNKAVGIIKRTRSNAIDGWLIHRFGDESRCIDWNDKHVLTSILPAGRWFAYEWLLGSSTAHNYFSAFRALIRRKYRGRDLKTDVRRLYEDAVESTNKLIRKTLKCDHDKILRTTRYFMRCTATASPFEFETSVDKDVTPILSYFQAFHNPVTGLPWPLDLVDASASLPRGFTREFVEEIEAELIRDPEVSDKAALLEYFSYLNPQKAED